MSIEGKKRLFAFACILTLLTTKATIEGNAVSGNLPDRPKLSFEDDNNNELEGSIEKGVSKTLRSTVFCKRGKEGHIA